MIRLLALLILGGLAATCGAAGPCPSTAGDALWSASCFERRGDVRQVKPAYRKRIRVDRTGHAVIFIAEAWELVAVDRHGVVAVPGIFHTGDFDYPRHDSGLVRFSDGKQCGYFEPSNFQIRIPAIYDHCRAFQDGSAVACHDCAVQCTESGCVDSSFVGGHGVELDKDNRVLREISFPPRSRALHDVN